MLYLGLGTSIGSTFIFDGTIVPLAVGHLSLSNGKSFEECVNRVAFEADEDGEWEEYVAESTVALKNAFLADYVVLGGGNTKKLEELPEAAAAAAITTPTSAACACGKTRRRNRPSVDENSLSATKPWSDPESRL